MGTKKITLCSIVVFLLMLSILSVVSGQKFYEAGMTQAESSTGSCEETTEEITEVTSEATGEETTEKSTEESTEEPTEMVTEAPVVLPTEAPTMALPEPDPWVYFNPEGMTMLSRINTPEGYVRAEVEKNSLGDFLRNYPLKEHGAPVLKHDGTLWEYQNVHAAVFGLPIEYGDFQQCADSIMRFYAEYFWSLGKTDNIAFYFTTGFRADYATWREGYRIQLNGNTFSWTLSAGYDDSYENFKEYLRYVFIYASTFSMDVYEAVPVSMDNLQIGDVFLHGGNPGHIVMVVDICYDENGRKAFLLADGHTPAMEFHIMKNLSHSENPWFYEEEIIYPFETFAHTYYEGELQRLNYLEVFDY